MHLALKIKCVLLHPLNGSGFSLFWAQGVCGECLYSKPLFSAQLGRETLTPQGGGDGENLFDLFHCSISQRQQETDRKVVGT